MLDAIGPWGPRVASLRWHLDSSVIDFIQRVGAELDVDEYG
jgi:hypothetical protein